MKALHFTSTLMSTIALCASLLAGCDRQDKNVPSLSSMGDPDTADAQGGMPAQSDPATDHGGLSMAPGADSAGRLDDTMAAPAAGLSSGATLSAAELQFVRQAIESNLYEIEAATLATDRARQPAVKQMAERLRADHQLAYDKLRLIAGATADLPTRMSEDKQAAIGALRNAGDATFDEQFLQAVGINSHEQAIMMFENANKDIRDPLLKGFVQDTLPTLKHHLSMTRDIRSTRKEQN